MDNLNDWITNFVGNAETWNLFFQVKYMLLVLTIEAFGNACYYLAGHLHNPGHLKRGK